MPRGDSGNPDLDNPSISNAPPFASVGLSIEGTDGADHYVGSYRSDVLSGAGGDDYLHGGGGVDLLIGGSGMDTLVARAGYSHLIGGTEADRYVIAASDSQAFVEDVGGVDRVVIPETISGSTIRRNGEALIIKSNGQLVTITIADHYSSYGRIETFEFLDGTLAASQVEAMAEEPSPEACYDERGVRIPCEGL